MESVSVPRLSNALAPPRAQGHGSGKLVLDPDIPGNRRGRLGV